jgi:hypothetical protein
LFSNIRRTIKIWFCNISESTWYIQFCSWSFGYITFTNNNNSFWPWTQNMMACWPFLGWLMGANVQFYSFDS